MSQLGSLVDAPAIRLTDDLPQFEEHATERKEGERMSASLASVGAITLFVEDPQQSKAFYQRVFELSSIYEDENSVVFKFENTIVNLLNASEADGLIAPATVGGRDAGARFQFSIWVDDANAVCSDLATRGVELLNGPIDRAWGMRTAAFADPDGHIWEIAQQLGEAA
jgi:Lactoylglutathione lyase and related lyases